ncbi:hypothetical protein DQT32_02890 [Salmonella enterica subsp. enterica serovar Braenderup]|nr:hypothetical protein [Salmonella enterica subsp. enterica serovar Braenderup]
MSNIYERIGEALLSNGEHDIIRAENKHEEDVLTKAGFTKVGSIKEGDQVVALFKIEQKTKEVIKIVEVPSKQQSWPWNDHKEVPGRPGIWYLNDNKTIPNQYQLYSYGTGTGDAEWMNHLGTTLSSNYTSNTESGYNTQKPVDMRNSISVGLYELATMNAPKNKK